MARINRNIANRRNSNSGRMVNNLTAKRNKLMFYLKKGLNVKDACILADVSDYLLGQMRSDPDFERMIQKSETQYKSELVDYVEDAASCGTWQAAAWLLERKFGDEYGKKDTIKHEYEIKLANFQQAVLDVVNSASPQLRMQIVQRLRELNLSDFGSNSIGNQNLIEHRGGSVVDAEYSQVS